MANTRLRNFNRILLVATCIVFVFFGYTVQVLLSELQISHFEEVGRNYASFMKNILHELTESDLEYARVLATNTGVKEYVNRPDNLVYEYRAERYLEEIIVRITGLESANIISYVDVDKYISSNKEKHELFIDTTYFETHAYYMSAMQSDETGARCYYIQAPIYRNNTVKGLVSLKVGNNNFSERFIENSRYQDTGLMLVANQDGQLLVTSDEVKIDRDHLFDILNTITIKPNVYEDELTDRYFYIKREVISEDLQVYLIFTQAKDELFELRARLFRDTIVMIVVLLFIYALIALASGSYYTNLISEDTKLVLEEEIQVQTKQLRKQARRDSLTQIYNHAVLLELLQEAIEGGQTVTVMMLDIDFFKEVNDNYGHPVGDEVLVELSRLLLKSIRYEDSVGRYGGEEFMLILNETDLEVGYMIAERIRLDVLNHEFSELKLKVTLSIGLAEYIPEEDDYLSLIKRADKHLYESKANGRNMTTM